MSVEEQLKKVQLWQEQCKLVVLFVGAVSAVAVFVYRVSHGTLPGLDQVKLVEPAAGGGMGAPRVMMHAVPAPVPPAHPGTDVIAVVCVFVFLVLVFLAWVQWRKLRRQREGLAQDKR